MSNLYGITLDPPSVRWAAAESVSETVIVAVLLLHERTVEEVVSKLSASELEQVIKLVARSPGCYPPGTLVALRTRKDTPPPEPVASTVAPVSRPDQAKA